MDYLEANSVPTYYIYRDGAANEPFDPTAPLQFFPAKDSDELWIALRNAFPHVSTHSERMRNAVIQFLMTEGQAQQAASAQPSPMMPLDSSMDMISNSTSPYSPYLSITSSSSSSSSSNGSPHLSAPSPAMATQPVQRTNSQSSTAPSASGIDGMTSVFSLTSHSQPKIRTRRRMTEDEKAEYRKRRSAGACQSCSARKRKCKHNKDACGVASSATVTTSTQKVSKLSSKKQGKQVVSTPTLAPKLPMVNHDAPQISFPVNDTSGDLLSFDDSELFPWQQDADWTLLDLDAPVIPHPVSHNHQHDSSVLGSSHRALSSSLPVSHGQDHDRVLLHHGGVSKSVLQTRTSNLLQTPVTAQDHDRVVSGLTETQLPLFAQDHDRILLDGDLLDLQHAFGKTDGFLPSASFVTSAQQPMQTLHAHAALSPSVPSLVISRGATVAAGASRSSVSGIAPSGPASSSTGRGGADGGHACSPTRVITASYGSIGSGLYGFDGLATSSPSSPQASQRSISASTDTALVFPRTAASHVPAASSSGTNEGTVLARPAQPRVPSGSLVASEQEGVLSTERPKVQLGPWSESRPVDLPADGKAPLSSNLPLLVPHVQVSPQRFASPSVFAAQVQTTLEAYLKAVGDIQLCLLCVMLKQLLQVKVKKEMSVEDRTLRSQIAMDQLTNMCGRMQLAVA